MFVCDLRSLPSIIRILAEIISLNEIEKSVWALLKCIMPTFEMKSSWTLATLLNHFIDESLIDELVDLLIKVLALVDQQQCWKVSFRLRTNVIDCNSLIEGMSACSRDSV